MPDFNKILEPGDLKNGLINTIVEIPQGSMLKIEWNRELACFELDRVEPQIFAKPVNYGFVPGTLDEDGDELDTLIVCDEPLPTGLYVKARVIGVMNFEDDGDIDHKVVCVPADERNTGDAIQSLDDLPERWKAKVEHHFSHYKDLKRPGTTKVTGWGDAAEAMKVVEESIARLGDKS
jgi:inorganic pyrophosphatase